MFDSYPSEEGENSNFQLFLKLFGYMHLTKNWSPAGEVRLFFPALYAYKLPFTSLKPGQSEIVSLLKN